MVYDIIFSILLSASLFDIRYKKIPNFLMLLYMPLGVMMERRFFVMRFIIYIFALSIFYMIRFFGAGDVKLIALIAGFLDYRELLHLLLIALFVAGVYSLSIMLYRRKLILRLRYFYNYIYRCINGRKIEKYIDFDLDRGELIPYSPCLLLGFIIWRYIGV